MVYILKLFHKEEQNSVSPCVLDFWCRYVMSLLLVSWSPARVKVYNNKAVVYRLSICPANAPWRHLRQFCTMGSWPVRDVHR